MALANIYSDPNYHNQNHCGILQALARKGVYLAEPNNTQLTETILIQNSPLKMVRREIFFSKKKKSFEESNPIRCRFFSPLIWL